MARLMYCIKRLKFVLLTPGSDRVVSRLFEEGEALVPREKKGEGRFAALVKKRTDIFHFYKLFLTLNKLSLKFANKCKMFEPATIIYL